MKSEKTYNLLRRIKIGEQVTISPDRLELMKQRELLEVMDSDTYSRHIKLAEIYKCRESTLDDAKKFEGIVRESLNSHNESKPVTLCGLIGKGDLVAWEQTKHNITVNLGKATAVVELAEADLKASKEARDAVQGYHRSDQGYIRLGKMADTRMQELRVRLDRVGELDYTHFNEELISAERHIQARVERWTWLVTRSPEHYVHGVEGFSGNETHFKESSGELRKAMTILSLPNETSDAMLGRFSYALEDLSNNGFQHDNRWHSYKTAATIARRGSKIHDYMHDLRTVWTALKRGRWDNMDNASIADFAVQLPPDKVDKFIKLRDELESYYQNWSGLDKVCVMLAVNFDAYDVRQIRDEFTRVGPPQGTSREPSYPLLACKVQLMGLDSEKARERWDLARNELTFGAESRIPLYPVYSELAAFDGNVEEGIEIFRKTLERVTKASVTHKFELDHLTEAPLITAQLYKSGWVRKEIKKT